MALEKNKHKEKNKGGGEGRASQPNTATSLTLMRSIRHATGRSQDRSGLVGGSCASSDFGRKRTCNQPARRICKRRRPFRKVPARAVRHTACRRYEHSLRRRCSNSTRSAVSCSVQSSIDARNKATGLRTSAYARIEHNTTRRGARVFVQIGRVERSNTVLRENIDRRAFHLVLPHRLDSECAIAYDGTATTRRRFATCSAFLRQTNPSSRSRSRRHLHFLRCCRFEFDRETVGAV